MDAEKVFKNLRLNKAQHILIANAPPEYEAALAGYSYDTKPAKDDGYDFIQVFATKQGELEMLLKEVGHAGKYDCLFWASYPKGTGKIKSDIKRETVWAAFDLINLEVVTAVAIDGTWSALRARPKDAIGKKR